jgi:4-hydroxyproline epimerase
MKKVRVIDSHTAGEPTRVVVAGGPSFGSESVQQQLSVFRKQFDFWRSAIVNEPRGSDVLVGAWLCEPQDKSCTTGVIFFNNVGYLGMCGHGLIGVMSTLRYLGHIRSGLHKVDTPVGIVSAEVKESGSILLQNVISYRQAENVRIDVPNVGTVSGDVAWGGNWFFLVNNLKLDLKLSNVEKLTEIAWAIRSAINMQGYPDIDHVELFGPGGSGGDSRNFVLCPGKAYDRSPCGTGTSAKLACLAAAGWLDENQIWVQESILGSQFRSWYHWADRDKKSIIPFIEGEAFVNADSNLLFDDSDPFCWGIRV